MKNKFTTKDIDKLRKALKKAGAKPTKFYKIGSPTKVYILKHKIPNLKISLIINYNDYLGKNRYGVEFKNILTGKRQGIEITKLLWVGNEE